ncbi:DUF4089 domain-containing protein [Crocosphaera watsonii]|uniref:DUF4089 domain-containing protein n=1 Tax=Crocosphaera watsonii WH 8502 TaxID=423474 RepID=T2IA37_CROWT|nr:DUF4089 domain-containing protein [Crocosphaera watsonii]CCQ49709.1 hypothetical protein CWATWH8502_851 [Crocosphaera watsonii WH 8502]
MNNNQTNLKQYIEQTSRIIDLPIAPEFMPGVVDNLSMISEIASFFTEFELPDNLEAAPIFEP